MYDATQYNENLNFQKHAVILNPLYIENILIHTWVSEED